MSYNIGKKINELRLEKKISQDDIASSLGMTRQRFARIENGQSDVSYKTLLQIADYMAIDVDEITKADVDDDLVLLFRDVENSNQIEAAVSKIQNILKTFHAHEKLYNNMKEKTDAI